MGAVCWYVWYVWYVWYGMVWSGLVRYGMVCMYYIYYMRLSLHTCNLIFRLFHPRVVPFHSHFFLIIDQHMFKTHPANNDGPYIPCKGANFSFKKLTKKASSNWAQNYRRPRVQDRSKREGGWLDVLDVPWENHWG